MLNSLIDALLPRAFHNRNVTLLWEAVSAIDNKEAILAESDRKQTKKKTKTVQSVA